MPSLFSILACLGRRFAATIFLFSVFGRPVMLLHIRHFNSCSLREERSTWYLYKMNVATFQFSLPVWGAIDSRCQLVQQGSISILAPCLGSDITEFLLQVLQLISILAPFVRSDMIDQLNLFEHWNFNSRSLCGSDVINYTFRKICFNSRPLRGERYTMMITDSLS